MPHHTVKFVVSCLLNALTTRCGTGVIHISSSDYMHKTRPFVRISLLLDNKPTNTEFDTGKNIELTQQEIDVSPFATWGRVELDRQTYPVHLTQSLLHDFKCCDRASQVGLYHIVFNVLAQVSSHRRASSTVGSNKYMRSAAMTFRAPEIILHARNGRGSICGQSGV